jgi:hypothetical protein
MELKSLLQTLTINQEGDEFVVTHKNGEIRSVYFSSIEEANNYILSLAK